MGTSMMYAKQFFLQFDRIYVVHKLSFFRRQHSSLSQINIFYIVIILKKIFTLYFFVELFDARSLVDRYYWENNETTSIMTKRQLRHIFLFHYATTQENNLLQLDFEYTPQNLRIQIAIHILDEETFIPMEDQSLKFQRRTSSSL